MACKFPELVIAVLKALGDKKGLEILNCLARGRSYCHELADAMGADPGNMSRNLAMLHNYGFLRQKRDAQKNYYETDVDAIRNFLQRVEHLLLP